MPAYDLIVVSYSDWGEKKKQTTSLFSLQVDYSFSSLIQYAVAIMLIKSRVKLQSPQNISSDSQQN